MQSTLTTDLLDFGRSFWASERAAREFPGIHASGYTPIGRFGIGFFSIFMAAEKVHMFSRRFDRGLEDVRCLSFENGISLRPILSATKPDDFGMDLCTRVELELKLGVVGDSERITIRCNLQGHEDFSVRFEDYVAAMVAGIDVPVFVETESGRRRVHDRFPPASQEREKWLETMSYVNTGANEKARAGLMRAIPRLREIRDGKKCYGVAAIDVLGHCGGMFLSSKAVGGLVDPHNRINDSFVGLIVHIPATARRDAGKMAAPKDSIDMWVSEQMDLLKVANLLEIESIFASYSICSLGYDPKDILQGLLFASQGGQRFMPMQAILNDLKNGLRLGFLLSPAIDHHLDQWANAVRIPGISTCVVIRNGNFNDAGLSTTGVPKEKNSLIGVVHRVLIEAGENPAWSVRENVCRTAFGQGDCLEVSI